MVDGVGGFQSVLVIVAGLVLLGFVVCGGLAMLFYKRCPPDRVMVVFGGGRNGAVPECRLTGKVVWPLINDHAYLSLEPIEFEASLSGVHTSDRVRVDMRAVFTVVVSAQYGLVQNAAERLLHVSRAEIRLQTKDIAEGQMRLLVGSLSAEEIENEREMLIGQIHENVTREIGVYGLELLGIEKYEARVEGGTRGA